MYIKRITTDDNNIDVNTMASLRGILLVAGVDAAAAAIYDALTVTGTAKLNIKAPAGTSFYLPIPGDNGFAFRVGASVDVTGTTPEAYFFFE